MSERKMWANMTPEELERAKERDRLRKRRFQGLLTERWVCIQRRVRGQTAGNRKDQLWLGLPTCTREEFMAWALSDKSDYLALCDAWDASGYAKGLAPSIDRIEDAKGYVIGNMRWLTVNEHNDISMRKGHETNKQKRQQKELVAA